MRSKRPPSSPRCTARRSRSAWRTKHASPKLSGSRNRARRTGCSGCWNATTCRSSCRSRRPRTRSSPRCGSTRRPARARSGSRCRRRSGACSRTEPAGPSPRRRTWCETCSGAPPGRRPSLPDIITYPSTTSHTGVHVSTWGGGKNQPRINIHFSTRDVDSGQTAHACSNLTICDVEKCIDLHHSRAIPILGAIRGFPDEPSPVHVGALAMARSNGGKAKAFFRANPSGAFDQYLQDIQKLPLIKDPAEERRLARRVQRGDEKAAERLVTANLRFVISYVKKYQGHGLDLSELVAIGNEGLLKAVKKFDPDQGVKFISYAVWWVRQAV